ncbi:hypothetical protein [Agromyces sp. SYSU T0242]|uniref:hypothetical protein n=1 Tax=Agromyces litoreus TaxID=3158561 RepID=UPI00339730E3
MDLAHAAHAGGLAGRRTAHRFTATEAEIAEAERRVLRRRAAEIESRVVYVEQGRHAAPRTA